MTQFVYGEHKRIVEWAAKSRLADTDRGWITPWMLAAMLRNFAGAPLLDA
jgi:hypothetical protein